MPDQSAQTIVVDWNADDDTMELWRRMTGQEVVRGPKPVEPEPVALGGGADEPAGPSGVAISDGATTPHGRTTSDGIELSKILHDRPDVFQAFFTEFYGPSNDRHSSAWTDRVGGRTPEDYANYWYETYGKHGDYAGAPARAPAEVIDYRQLLLDRPDVFQASFTEYWGPNNDRHSSVWVDRVGGTTPEDYARYWYETYGKAEGYTQHAAPAAPPAAEESPPPAQVVDPAPVDPLVLPEPDDILMEVLPPEPADDAAASDPPADDGAGEATSLMTLDDPSSGFGCLLS